MKKAIGLALISTENHGATIMSGCALVVTLFFSLSVFAHHGWSGNTAGDVTITGVLIEKVELRGPHGTMKIRDSDGQHWNITLAPGPRTHRAGLKASVIPLGDVVTVHGARNDDLGEFEAKVRRVEWREQVFDVYPAK